MESRENIATLQEFTVTRRKVRTNGLPLSNQNFSKPTNRILGLFKNIQGPPLFQGLAYAAFKFKKFQGPAGTLLSNQARGFGSVVSSPVPMDRAWLLVFGSFIGHYGQQCTRDIRYHVLCLRPTEMTAYKKM